MDWRRSQDKGGLDRIDDLGIAAETTVLSVEVTVTAVLRADRMIPNRQV